MKQSTRRLFGGLAIAAGALAAAGAIIMKRNSHSRRRSAPNRWARPGMKVVFRAELMPGRDTSERTFRVTELLPSGRVLLDRAAGEHAEKEFQPLRLESVKQNHQL